MTPTRLLILAALALPPLLLLALFPNPAAGRHLFLAGGLLPLILGAMTFFIPSLTRTRPPEAATLWPPLLGLLAGVTITAALAGGWRFLLPAAALFALAATLLLLRWIRARRRLALGDPHPGLSWYVAALACLFLALIAILAGHLFPDHGPTARLLHLHLNLLGFIALTVLGTLPVLIPTVGGFFDPTAALRLHRDLPWSAVGVLFIALGAAFLPPLALAGLLLLAKPLPGLLAILHRHRQQLLPPHWAGTSLLAATGGFSLLLAASAFHALGDLSGDALFPMLWGLFLAPLLTGALSHLLPLWREMAHPSGNKEARRLLLDQTASLRLPLFLLSALPGTGWFSPFALGAGILLFLFSGVRASRI